MAILKPCPFCEGIPKVKFNNSEGNYYLQCDICKQKNIILICKADTIDTLIQNWNERWFDNKLKENKEEYLQFIDNYYYNLSIVNHPEKRDRKFEVLSEVTSESQLVEDSYGYLIFNDGEVLDCNMYGHPELLLKKYGINEYRGTFDHSQFCADHKIVKVTLFNSYLTIDIPKEYSNKQIDACFETLLRCDYLKQMTKFSIFSHKIGSFQTFYTLDELLNTLDNL